MGPPKLECKERLTPSLDCCTPCNKKIVVPTVESIQTDLEYQRQPYLEEIKKSIAQKRCALALGAGISIPCGMPTWPGLISKLMGYSLQANEIDAQHDEITRGLIGKKIQILGGVNALESAEYVSNMLGRKNPGRGDHFSETAIWNMICHMVDETTEPGKTTRPNTMDAVAKLMAVEGGIRRAMTYNYDPLVQEHMMDAYRVDSHLIRTHPMGWSQNRDHVDELREIYHVHGFIPGKRHLSRGLPGVYPQVNRKELILTETSYYRTEQLEAYNWSSSIQAWFLNYYNCVFVGFSADDYNFRRILRQRPVKKNWKPEERHYLILTIDDWMKDIYRSICLAKKEGNLPATLDISEETIYLLRNILQAREKYWRDRGFLPIWVTVKEIPTVLNSLIPQQDQTT